VNDSTTAEPRHNFPKVQIGATQIEQVGLVPCSPRERTVSSGPESSMTTTQSPSAPSGRQVAIICDTVPYPTRSGDNQRIAELISVLREQGWSVHLVLCGLVERRFKKICRSHVDALHTYSGTGLRTWLRNGLRRSVRWLDHAGNVFALPPMETIAGRLLGRPVSPLLIDYWQRYPNGLSEFVAELQASFSWDAVIVEYIWLHRSIDNLKNGTIRLLDTHDIQHKRVEEFASRGMVFPLKITRDEERRIFDRFDAVIAIQSAEADLIKEMCPQTRVLTVGSSGHFPVRTPTRPVDGRLLYVGGYNGANLDGLRRFLHDGWPEILRQIPSATLHVCGHIDRGFTGHRFENVKFLGHKETLDDEYAAAAVLINPVWIGTGLKIKTVEALSRGKPLVTTPKGIEGLPPGAEQSALIAEDDESFAGAVVRLMTDGESRQALSCSALTFAHTHLNQRAVYQELFQFLDRAGQG
jgi:glycosyltransferase involved in cell wall biosynthesis